MAGIPLTDTMPYRRPDRVALVARRVASATQQSCRVVARVTRQNEVSVEHCLCRHDRVEVRTRSRPATHADPHHFLFPDFCRLAIHHHLAPLPECRDWATGNSCSTFV